MIKDFDSDVKKATRAFWAGCIAWEEFALGNQQIEYHKSGGNFIPEAGDIVLYDS